MTSGIGTGRDHDLNVDGDNDMDEPAFYSRPTTFAGFLRQFSGVAACVLIYSVLASFFVADVPLAVAIGTGTVIAHWLILWATSHTLPKPSKQKAAQLDSLFPEPSRSAPPMPSVQPSRTAYPGEYWETKDGLRIGCRCVTCNEIRARYNPPPDYPRPPAPANPPPPRR